MVAMGGIATILVVFSVFIDLIYYKIMDVYDLCNRLIYILKTYVYRLKHWWIIFLPYKLKKI